MTTNQTAPVTDEELDQMIWKLERDGMTPKMLSLMRELREVRRAKGEPVAWVRYCSDGTIDGPLMNYQIEDCRKSTWTPLYTTPPAPVVPDELADNIDSDDHPLLWSYNSGWNACRAATLNHSGNSEQLEPVSNRDELNSPATPDGFVTGKFASFRNVKQH